MIELWTDGSCSPNPGPGGWAAILRTKLPDGTWHEKEISGGKIDATNNRMEMQAVEEGLKAITKPGCSITVYTDSQLVIGYFKFGWKARSSELRQAVGRICARRDLMGHTIRWVKVKAHNGNELNERVDRLAKEARPAPFEKVEADQAELIPL